MAQRTRSIVTLLLTTVLTGLDLIPTSVAVAQTDPTPAAAVTPDETTECEILVIGGG
jgi:hypothetical protein